MTNIPDLQPGHLYLGRDPESGAPCILPGKQLTTHAAIIGMTGSGKTGLGIALLEELALAKVPALVIDPKGDMANLLLTFPNLAPQDFAPWIDPDQAARLGMSVEDAAAATAASWQQGLADWGEDGARIQRLKESADFVVFTPGSQSGCPVSALAELDAPPPEVMADRDTLTGLVNATASSILSLVGIEADPMKSREHVLLTSILLHFWDRAETVTLATLISSVATPPFAQVGVFPVDAFYPQNKRMELAMQLNTLVASPAFQGWLAGEPLSVDKLLGCPGAGGKPRVCIFSIAHLADSERMFFVTLLLGRVIDWMRRQQGSDSLRAVLYMDEIFGYFPPNANPPSKTPMLLLLKQARAFGLGVVLATQNPVDLDYKGMANMGSWFVGRLQTRQDQERVVAGMAGDAAEGRDRVRELLAGLQKRHFLLYSAHRDKPQVFTTRWTLSYLKGPITLAELGKLAQAQQASSTAHGPGGADSSDLAGMMAGMAGTMAGLAAASGAFSPDRPLVAAGIVQYYEPAPSGLEEPRYRARLLGLARLHQADQRRGIDRISDVALLAALPEAGAGGVGSAGVRWDEAESCEARIENFIETPPAQALFAALPGDWTQTKTFESEKKRLIEHLYHHAPLALFRVKALGLESAPDESEADFRDRVSHALALKTAEARDQLARDFAKKRGQIQEKLQRAQLKLDKEKQDVRMQGLDTLVSVGSAVAGIFFGRGAGLTRSTQGARGVGRFMKERQEAQLAQEGVTRLEQELEALNAEEQRQLDELADAPVGTDTELERVRLTLKKSDIFDVRLCLLWSPEDAA